MHHRSSVQTKKNAPVGDLFLANTPWCACERESRGRPVDYASTRGNTPKSRRSRGRLLPKERAYAAYFSVDEGEMMETTADSSEGTKPAGR